MTEMADIRLIKTKSISLVGMEGELLQLFSDALSSHADISCYESEKNFFSELFKMDKFPDLCFIAIEGCNTERTLKLLSSLKSVDVPAVCIFGNNDLGLELRCLSYGACDIIHLPIGVDGIMAKADFVFQKEFVQALIIDGKRNGKNKKMAGGLDMLVYQTLTALSSSIDAKDSYTQGHSSRVALFSSILGKAYGYNRDELNTLHHSALMHDVGKIGMPDVVLRKPGKLSKAEKEVIQRHPIIGYEILRSITLMPEMALVARYHHERWDGAGYPDGLSKEEIPLNARIVSIADSLDAMTSNRSYREPLTFNEAADELLRCKGTQFDPYLAELGADIIMGYLTEGRLPAFSDII